jgi:hypothetical protein
VFPNVSRPGRRSASRTGLGQVAVRSRSGRGRRG